MRSRSDAAVLGWLLLSACTCRETPPPKPPPPAPVAVAAPQPQPQLPVDAGSARAAPGERKSALVLSLSGAVEVRRGDGSEWLTLAVGDPIQVGDKVRLAPDGQLELSFDVAEIKLHQGSELELTVLEPREVRLAVTGSAEAQMPGGDVSISGGGSVARSAGGRISFSYDGRTAVAGVLSGDASLTAGGKSVGLKNGEFATASEGGLTGAAKIPRNFSLEVDWPPEAETNKASVAIKGRVSGRARLAVGGRRVEPAADGSFGATVTLRPGRQTVFVTASDAFGRRASRAHQFVLDPEALKVKGAVEYH